MATRVTGSTVVPIVRCGVALPRNVMRRMAAGTVRKGRARVGGGGKDRRMTLCDEPRCTRSAVATAASTKGIDDGAVLLFGATGRVGRCVLQQFLEMGRPVIAAVRSAAKLAEMRVGGDGMRVVDGVDMTKPETLTAALFSGVEQVVICTGPSWTDGNPFVVGSDPYAPETIPAYAVDSVGVVNVVAAAERHLTPMAAMTVLDSVNVSPDMKWTVTSSGDSTSQIVPDATGIRMEGTLEQGGRMRDLLPQGTIQWTADCALDLTDVDGVTFSVKGDGRSHFIAFQNAETGSDPQSFFAASFDTVDGQWTDVKIPLHQFRLSRQGIPDQTATLSASSITKLGWMSSTITLDGFPNKKSPAGPFSFTVASVSTYKAARPQLVVLSSGAVERNARIGDRMDLRNNEIPTIRLNPGGILNHKYEGENTVRCSFLPYTIICPTQLIPDELEAGGLEPNLIEFSQGDTKAGRLRCVEVAEVVMQCLQRPEAVSKTFQMRRSLGIEAKNKSMTAAQYLCQFLALSNDEDRAKVGLPLFPEPIPMDAPSWRGGRRNERPDDATVESIFQQGANMRAQREKEILATKQKS